MRILKRSNDWRDSKMSTPFDCQQPDCMGKMVLHSFIEDYDFDHEGNIEYDDDDMPIFIEYALYECDQCQHMERRFHRYIYDPPGWS